MRQLSTATRATVLEQLVSSTQAQLPDALTDALRARRVLLDVALPRHVETVRAAHRDGAASLLRVALTGADVARATTLAVATIGKAEAADAIAARSRELLVDARAQSDAHLLCVVAQLRVQIFDALKARYRDLVEHLSELALIVPADFDAGSALAHIEPAMREAWTAVVDSVGEANSIRDFAREIDQRVTEADDSALHFEWVSTRRWYDSLDYRNQNRYGAVGSIPFWLRLVQAVPLDEIQLLTDREKVELSVRLFPGKLALQLTDHAQ